MILASQLYMHRTDYGVVSLAELGEPTATVSVTHAGLTTPLGCSGADVDAYRLDGDGVLLSSQHEQLCIPVGGEGTLTVEESMTVPSPGLALVPASRECTLGGPAPTTWVVVGVPGDPASDRQPATVDASTCAFTTPETSEILTARITRQLGCTGMKVNVRRLNPGEAVPYHVEGWQEELFVPLTGPGTMRIADDTHHVPRGSISRVGPETPRSAVNDGDDPLLWAMVGFPPTGGSEEWDPGALILE